jgi:hypothetical protein
MRLTLLGKKGRAAVTFGQRLKVLCIEWVDSTKATELEEYFRERGVEVAHQAIGSYFSGRSVPELPRLVAMMEAMELDEDEKRSLVQAYAERRPGLKEICSYLVDIC